MSPFCPSCQSKKIQPLFLKDERRFFVCQNCGLKFVWPIPSKAEVKHFYQRGYWQRGTFRKQTIAGYLDYKKEKDSLLDYFQKILFSLQRVYPNVTKDNSKILDIGCGPGFFLAIAKKQTAHIYGVDLSAPAVAEAQKMLKTKNIFLKDLLQANFRADFFDLVACFQTIEHLPDLDKFLTEVRQILKLGGVFVISTPNAAGWKAKLMGRRWLSFRHPDHFYFFDLHNLTGLLKRNEFVKIKKIKDPARIYELGYYGLGLLKYFLPSIKWEGMIKILCPFGKIKIRVPLDSLVMTAQKL